ncbi:MAG: 3-hydroxyacyl-ACP dehydratase FabZ [Acidimicrobiales bacterium]
MLNPEDVLPHRAPFLFVDEVVEVEPGQRATARWNLTSKEAFFAGHFPGYPVLPGVLIVEALAQTGALAVLTDERFAGRVVLLGGVDRARFRRQVTPGDTLDMSTTLERLSSGGAGYGNGRATVNGELACEARLLFVCADRR